MELQYKTSYLRNSEACEVLVTVRFEKKTLNATSLAEKIKKHEFLFERAAFGTSHGVSPLRRCSLFLAIKSVWPCSPVLKKKNWTCARCTARSGERVKGSTREPGWSRLQDIHE